MEQVRDSVLSSDRFTLLLFSCFAAVALLLAALGIYGVMSFSVAQRSHEIALRMALGAGRNRVVAQVVKEGLLFASVGAILQAASLIACYFPARRDASVEPMQVLRNE